MQVAEFYNQFPETRGKRLVLFMGRIHPKKGCDLALHAFANVLSGDLNWHLVMAGPDQVGWASSLQSLAAELRIQNRVTWTGMLNGDLKAGATGAAEVMLLPSHQENFGIVVAEALAQGVPVLISNKVNIWREVEHDGAGIIATDDVAGASSLLDSWLRLGEAQKLQMRTSALASFEKRFEIRQASTTLLEILQEIVSRQNNLGLRSHQILI